MADMDEKKVVHIKQEEIHEFLQDPLKIEELGIQIKEDPEMDARVDGSELNFQQDPLKLEESCVNIKQDLEMETGVDSSEPNFLQDPLRIEETCITIKQDPEMDTGVDNSEPNPQGSSVGSADESRVASGDDGCSSRVCQPAGPLPPRRPPYSQYHCAVYRCATNCHKMPGVTRHSFPEDERLRREWLARCRRTSKVNLKNSRVCSVHFRPEDYERDLRNELLGLPLRRKLIPTAVPTLNLPSEEDDELTFVLTSPHSVVPSTSYASNSTRLIQNGDESCQEQVVHSELERNLDESKHFAIFGEEEEDDGENSFFRTALKCSLGKNKLTNFDCSICLQSFTSKYCLIMHVFVHIDGVQPPKYVCKSCGDVFPSNLSLNTHLKLSEIAQSLSADIEKFDYSDLLDSNMSGKLNWNALLHTKAKYKKCDVCGKSFRYLAPLKRHALIHSGSKPHKCDVCGKYFIQLSDLKKHALLHSGPRPHKCAVCGKTYTRLTRLKRHALIHSGSRPHKCDVCGKSFTYLSEFKRHALISFGIKPTNVMFVPNLLLSCLILRDMHLNTLEHDLTNVMFAGKLLLTCLLSRDMH